MIYWFTVTPFGAAVIEFLGHNVSHQGIHPTSAKVLAISELRAPTNVHELQSVLGFCNYYRRFVPNYSQLQQPLNALLKKGAQWQWAAEHQQAFDELKAALCREGNALRRFDPSLPTKLYTDWSKKGIGAVLAQEQHASHAHLTKLNRITPAMRVKCLLQPGPSKVSVFTCMECHLL